MNEHMCMCVYVYVYNVQDTQLAQTDPALSDRQMKTAVAWNEFLNTLEVETVMTNLQQWKKLKVYFLLVQSPTTRSLPRLGLCVSQMIPAGHQGLVIFSR